MKNFKNLLYREFIISFQNTKSLYSYCTFFFTSILLFVFAIGPDILILSTIYKPILWMITIFSIIFESVNYGNFEKRSVNNELQGKFSANDLNLTVGLAKKIKKTNYSYGLNTSLFSSNINNLRYKSLYQA